jgi:hypothetical protein
MKTTKALFFELMYDFQSERWNEFELVKLSLREFLAWPSSLAVLPAVEVGCPPKVNLSDPWRQASARQQSICMNSARFLFFRKSESPLDVDSSAK